MPKTLLETIHDDPVLKEIQQKIEELGKEHSKIEKRFQELFNEEKARISELIVSNVDKDPFIFFEISAGSQLATLLYTQKDECFKQFPQLKFNGNYFVDTLQHCVGITIPHDLPNLDLIGLAKFMEEQVFPRIKPTAGRRTPDEKYKCIKIFEHTLSEFGVFNLVKKSNAYVIEKMTYGRTEDHKSFSTLYDALVYIREKLYYPEINTY